MYERALESCLWRTRWILNRRTEPQPRNIGFKMERSEIGAPEEKHLVNRHMLWSLALITASASLLGCSRTSSNVSAVILPAPEIAQSRPEVLKPSPCIKWDDASARLTKPLRKGRGTSVGKSPQKT